MFKTLVTEARIKHESPIVLENEISPPAMVNLKIYCKNKMINGRGEFQAAVSIRIKIFIRVRTHSQTSRLIKRWWSWIRRIARVSVCENRKRELFPYVVSREGEGRERERESEREKRSFGLRRIEKKIQNLAGFLITCLLPRFKRTNRCMMYDVCIYVCTHAMFPIKSRLWVHEIPLIYRQPSRMPRRTSIRIFI